MIGEFGEERRAVVKIGAVPKAMRDAILAAEDERFYQHGGVDYVGVIRAAMSNFVSGGARQGASTITMQVARNFFLSKEKTLTRKFNEMLLAFKIEHSLTKDQILELYVNQIYLGQRAYGFAAAAQIYFGKTLDQLNIAEMAMLAGLPESPIEFQSGGQSQARQIAPAIRAAAHARAQFHQRRTMADRRQATAAGQEILQRFRRKSRPFCRDGAAGGV